MSGTFVTKFSLFTITNKVFHTSNKEQTNISNKGDVYYERGAKKTRKNHWYLNYHLVWAAY